MATQIYQVGDVAAISVNFVDQNGNPINPTGVELIVRSPSGIETTYNSPTNPTTGTFNQNVPLTASKIWTWEWTSTGAANSVVQGWLTVQDSILVGVNPSPLDLCTLDQVKTWLSLNSIQMPSSASDLQLQQLITAAGMEWLTMTGLVPQSGDVPSASPLNSICTFNETYDGNGSIKQFVKNPPIQVISAITIGLQTIPPSTVYGQFGFVITDNGKSISLRNGTNTILNFNWGCTTFFEGIQNVNVQYTGGFSSLPADINEACIEMVGLTFKKSGWIGLKSVSLSAGGGSTTYADWAIEPHVAQVIDRYTRRAIV